MNSHNNKSKVKEHPKLNQYSIEDILGHGSYGKVKLASHKITNEKVAIKYIEKSKLRSLNDTQRIQSEMKIISQLNHPNIIKEIEMFEDEKYFYIVMERPTKGDLFKYICSKKRLSLKEASFMFYQIVNAVDYIHKKGIVHRDLKPENILLSEDMIIQLGDFGLSSVYQEGTKLKTTCGSPAYSAPEMLRGRKYDPIPVDIWGLGVILYVMICGQLPFEEENEAQLFVKISHCDIKFPYYCDAQCKALIKKILLSNPNERLTMNDIKASNVYITGRANFLKEFKIYDDDGSVLPQVYSYMKEKALDSLDLCMIEKTKNIEKTAAFLIFYYKLLHKTDWQNYNIPIHSLKDRAIISLDKENNKDSGLKSKLRPKKKSLMKNLLLIRNHSTMSEALSTNRYLVNSIEPKEKLLIPHKLPMLEHSFDSTIQSKHISKFTLTQNNSKTERVQSLNSSAMKKAMKQKNNKTSIINTSRGGGSIDNKSKAISHRNNNNKTSKYTIEDYERDLRYLHKRGYRHTSLAKIKPGLMKI